MANYAPPFPLLLGCSHGNKLRLVFFLHLVLPNSRFSSCSPPVVLPNGLQGGRKLASRPEHTSADRSLQVTSSLGDWGKVRIARRKLAKRQEDDDCLSGVSGLESVRQVTQLKSLEEVAPQSQPIHDLPLRLVHTSEGTP